MYHKDVHYVYCHKNPLTDEILYVGRGSGERAYHYKGRASGRSKVHTDLLVKLNHMGFVPHEWVVFLECNVS